MHREDLFHQFSCQHTGFVRVNMDADNVARVDVDHHVRIEVLTFPRTGELGDVLRMHLPGRSRDQFRTRHRRLPREPPALGDLRILTQDSVHRGHRTQVRPFVEELSEYFPRSLVDESIAN